MLLKTLGVTHWFSSHCPRVQTVKPHLSLAKSIWFLWTRAECFIYLACSHVAVTRRVTVVATENPHPAALLVTSCAQSLTSPSLLPSSFFFLWQTLGVNSQLLYVIFPSTYCIKYYNTFPATRRCCGDNTEISSVRLFAGPWPAPWRPCLLIINFLPLVYC